MRSNAGRALLGVALIVLAVVLLFTLKDDDGGDSGGGGGARHASRDDSKSGQGNGPHKPAIPTIVVKAGEPVGGIVELSFDQGEQIRFKVRSDTREEVHVHGYDIAKEVEAGGTVSFAFPAMIEGIFEVELEGVGEQIAELQVNP